MIDFVGDRDTTTTLLAGLHRRHMIVLDDRPQFEGEIRMALPFSAHPTEHVVAAGERSWWANCAWDSLAIVAALGIDADITSAWTDTQQPVELSIADGDLADSAGLVHFAVPAARWWDDIVET